MLEFHIEVHDVERSFAFYRELLPYKKELRWSDGQAGALVLADGSAFGIWKNGKRGLYDGRGGAHLHFAFQIKPDEYEAVVRKLTGMGLDPVEHTWPSGERSVYFFDPDGHQGEFMTCDWFGFSSQQDS